MTIRYNQNFIDGEWRDSVSGEMFNVVNPSTGSTLISVPSSEKSDVDSAVSAARRAARTWRETTPGERSEMLLALADALLANLETFGSLESLNVGKPLAAAQDEVRSAVDRLRFFAGAARNLSGLAAGEYVKGYTSMIRREPIGVAGLITPWNYPLLMAVTKMAPALAAGNTVVLKPSEHTPLSTLNLAALIADIFPRGVVNIITGYGTSAGMPLVEHPEVDIVSLTGGSATGKHVARAAADSLKRVQLELGGKAPVLVLDDADPTQVAETLRTAGFWNAGQDCSAASRMLISNSIYDRVIEELVPAVSSLTVGSPNDPAAEMGPLAYEGHRDRVLGFVERAQADGGTILTGGKQIESSGYFIEPTIIADIDQRAEAVQKEIFGPVVTVQRVDDDEAAYSMANDVAYGLGASVFTRDVGRAMQATRKLDFNTVWVNDHGLVTAEMPWGGCKESGYGTERSMYSVEEFTEIKHAMFKLPN